MPVTLVDQSPLDPPKCSGGRQTDGAALATCGPLTALQIERGHGHQTDGLGTSPIQDRYGVLAESKRAGPEVFTLASDEIDGHWPLIAPFLSLVKDGDWTIAGVKSELEDARAQLWGMIQLKQILAIWVTKIEETSKGRRGVLWIAAGSQLDEGLRLFREYTEPWLASMGCKSVQIIGRKGWERVLRDYREAGVVLVKEWT